MSFFFVVQDRYIQTEAEAGPWIFTYSVEMWYNR